MEGLRPNLLSKFVVAPTPAKAGGLSHERPPTGFPARYAGGNGGNNFDLFRLSLRKV